MEANHPYAEVHLHCGTRERIGAPLSTPSSSLYNHGWSRLVSPQSDDSVTIRHPLFDRDFRKWSSIFLQNFILVPIGITTPSTMAAAFTYPHGRLTTFELDYGPKGWFLKYLFGSSNMTATRFIQTTTTQWPIVKWNSTWRYFRRTRPRTFTTRTTISTTTLGNDLFLLSMDRKKTIEHF